MIYVFPLDLDHLEPAPSKPGAAKRVRLSLSPGPATPPGSEVDILGHRYSYDINFIRNMFLTSPETSSHIPT